MSRARVGRSGLIVLGLTIAAFVLRYVGIDQSLFGDEVFTYDIVTKHGLGGVLDEVHRTSITPPLHYVLAWASVQLGDPTETIRIPSLVAGTLTVPAIWRLGRATVGDAAGVVGAGIAALSPFAIYYGQEARTYAVLVLLVTLSTLGLVRALQTGRRGWWAVFVLSSAGALYSHYTAVFPLIAQFAWAMWTQPTHRRAILTAHAATAVLYIPWLPFYLGQRHNAGIEAIGFLYPFSLHAALTDLVRLIVGHPFLPVSDLPGDVVAAVAAAALIVALVGVLSGIYRDRLRRGSTALILLLVLAFAAPVGEVLYALIGDTIYAPRNLLSSFVALSLVVGAGVTRCPRVVGSIALGTIGLVLVIGVVRESQPSSGRPPWNNAAAVVDADARATDPVAVLAYLAGSHPVRRPALRSLAIFLQKPHERLVQLNGDRPSTFLPFRTARRVWVVVNQLTGLPGVPPPPRMADGLTLSTRRTWDGFSDVALYEYVRR